MTSDPPPGDTDGAVSSRSRPRVWVIDDSPLQAASCQEALAARFDVSVFTGGTQAIEALSLSGPPSVVVLDWYMPELSGAEVCAALRERFDLAELPIVVITGLGDGETLFQGAAAGANDFLRKPFSEQELTSRVATLAQVSSLHRKLADARSTLRDEADFRDKFLGMLAHDLRQPLNTIFMAGQLLAATAPVSSYLDMQLRAAGRMKRMIEELLDFTRNRPETGLQLVRHDVLLSDVVRNSVEEISLAHPGRSVRLHVDGRTNGNWDVDRLAQLCSNLISNALEHGSDAAVEVHVADDGGEVVLRVTNQGPPLAAEQVEGLFAPFRRGPTRSSKRRGVGLGLYIASQIVSSHGGTISAHSDAGGTHFVARLPREAP